MHRIFNTNLQYSSASFTLKFDEKSSSFDKGLIRFYWSFGTDVLFWATQYTPCCQCKRRKI